MFFPLCRSSVSHGRGLTLAGRPASLIYRATYTIIMQIKLECVFGVSLAACVLAAMNSGPILLLFFCCYSQMQYRLFCTHTHTQNQLLVLLVREMISRIAYILVVRMMICRVPVGRRIHDLWQSLN